MNIGKGIEVANIAVQAMKVRKKILNNKYHDILDRIAILGLVYKLNSRWEAAEELFVQVMETRKKKLKADYPSTLSSIANLALTYRDQGR